jgi:hypothetical protein
MIQPCRLILAVCLTVLTGHPLADSKELAGMTSANVLPTFASYAYDAKVAWLDAGELALHLNRADDAYEFAGFFATSREMNAYYSWNGVFAGVGRWDGSGPTSDAYLARSVSKDHDLKIVVMSDDGVRRLDEPDGEFESLDRPAGNDLISALFFTPACYAGGYVHDGEDAYRIELRDTGAREMSEGQNYYAGSVTDCRYDVFDDRGRKRRVTVSLADVGGRQVAVEVRVKIPLLPDPVFRLKTPVVRSGTSLVTR